MLKPLILTHNRHKISHQQISKNALSVLYRLDEAGYRALLVGGAVRDLWLGKKPKDFDVATNATPEQIARLFHNCRLIGRRFRLAHVHFGRDIIEVATFRGHHKQSHSGMIKRDNVYGKVEEDALRRDFTINALYYDIQDGSILDYASGLADLKHRKIRLLGQPQLRYAEDPVRMIRAIRFAAKLNFTIQIDAERLIYKQAALLRNVPPARLFDEVLKLFLGGNAIKTFALLRQYQLFPLLFPLTEKSLKQNEIWTFKLIQQGMQNTDQRIQEGKPVTPAFLFAIFLWESIRCHAKKMETNGLHSYPALQQAISSAMAKQLKYIAIPKRISSQIREIWTLQYRFQNTHSKKAKALLEHPRFRAAYDFLLLRVHAGEIPQHWADFWTQLQLEQGLDPHNKKRQYHKKRHD